VYVYRLDCIFGTGCNAVSFYWSELMNFTTTVQCARFFRINTLSYMQEPNKSCDQQNPIRVNQGQSMRIIVISHSTRHHSSLLKEGTEQ